MWVRFVPFDGSQNINDFFQDLTHYLAQTGITANQKNGHTLIPNITGEARVLYRILESPIYDSLKTVLEEHFNLTDWEKRQLKLNKNNPNFSWNLAVESC